MAERLRQRAVGPRDPWFDLEGKTARRGRRTRMIVELVAFAVCLSALWIAIFIRLYG
ncbi:MAG: hypothetical protein ABWY52_01555 [Candidatus Limnocylindrales bacterium]